MRAGHATANTPFINRVEEEFGSLKRALDRRTAHRSIGGALPDRGDDKPRRASTAHANDRAHADDSFWGQAEDIDANPGREYLAAKTSLGSVQPLAIASAPLSEPVRHAVVAHAVAVETHKHRWDNGRDKLHGAYAAIDADSAALQTLVMQSRNMEPAVLESGSVMSNMQPIADLLRGLGGVLDDPVEVSTFSALHNVFEADFTPREKQLLKIVQQQTAKIQTMAATIADLESQKMHAAEVHAVALEALAAQHREAMDEAKETADYEVHRERNECEALQLSLDMLQKAQKEQIAAAQRSREEGKQRLDDTIAAYNQECSKWEQAVAQLDREKYDLARTVKTLEATASDATARAEQALKGAAAANASSGEQLLVLQQELAALQAHASQLEEALEQRKGVPSRPPSATVRSRSPLDKLAPPDTAEQAVLVDTDALVSEARDELNKSRTLCDGLKKQLEELKRTNAALSRTKASLELEKREAAAMIATTKALAADLDTTRKKASHAHKRRVQLVCANYILRSQVAVLQSSTTVSERLEQLTAERAWLMQRLQHSIPVRYNLSLAAKVERLPREAEDTGALNGGNVIFVRDAETQFEGPARRWPSPLGGAAAARRGSSGIAGGIDVVGCDDADGDDPNRHDSDAPWSPAIGLVWKCMATQVVPTDIIGDVDGVEGLQRDHIRRYLHAHEGYGRQVLHRYAEAGGGGSPGGAAVSDPPRRTSVSASSGQRRASSAAALDPASTPNPHLANEIGRPTSSASVVSAASAIPCGSSAAGSPLHGIIQDDTSSVENEARLEKQFQSRQQQQQWSAASTASRPPSGSGTPLVPPPPQQQPVSSSAHQLPHANASGTADPHERRISPVRRDSHHHAMRGSSSALAGNTAFAAIAITGRAHDVSEAFLMNPCNYSVTKKRHGLLGAKGLHQEQAMLHHDLQRKFTDVALSSAAAGHSRSGLSDDPSCEARGHIPSKVFLSTLSSLTMQAAAAGGGGVPDPSGMRSGRHALRPATPQLKFPAGAWRPATPHSDGTL